MRGRGMPRKYLIGLSLAVDIFVIVAAVGAGNWWLGALVFAYGGWNYYLGLNRGWLPR